MGFIMLVAALLVAGALLRNTQALGILVFWFCVPWVALFVWVIVSEASK